jgi:hypothetical protein
MLSALPTGFPEAIDHVDVVFRAHSRYAVADIHVELGRGNHDGFLQRLLCFGGAPKLAESCGQPAISQRIIRLQSDRPFRHRDQSLEFVGETETQRHLI